MERVEIQISQAGAQWTSLVHGLCEILYLQGTGFRSASIFARSPESGIEFEPVALNTALSSSEVGQLSADVGLLAAAENPVQPGYLSPPHSNLPKG